MRECKGAWENREELGGLVGSALTLSPLCVLPQAVGSEHCGGKLLE